MSRRPSRGRVFTTNPYFSMNWNQTFSAVLFAMGLWGLVLLAVILTDPSL